MAPNANGTALGPHSRLLDIVRNSPRLLDDLSLVSDLDQLRSESATRLGEISLFELDVIAHTLKHDVGIISNLALFGLSVLLMDVAAQAKAMNDA